MNKQKFNRRIFFKTALTAITLFTVGVWDKIVKTQTRTNKKSVIKIPFNQNKKIIFADEYIVVNETGQTKVFSAHCTHLGCSIHEFKNGRFICPCHGSEFSTAGEALKGPAYKPLKEINFEFGGNKEFLVLKG